MAVLVTAADLATVSLEGFVYGVFFVLAGWSTYLLARRELTLNSRVTLRGLIRNPMGFASIIITMSVTTHWVLVVVQSFLAFVYFEQGTAPTLEYAIWSFWPWVARITLLGTTALIFDAVMIYRVWVIWGHSLKPIIFPTLCFFGEFAASVGQTVVLTQYQLDGPVQEDDKWSWSAVILTLATNAYCATLISWKLRKVCSGTLASGTSLLSLLAIIVESAALYATWTALFFAITLTNSVALRGPIGDLWCPVSGLAFMLINVRVGAGWGRHNRFKSSPPRSEINFVSRGLATPGNTLELGTMDVTRLANSGTFERSMTDELGGP